MNGKYTSLDAAVDGDEAATAELAELRRELRCVRTELRDVLDALDREVPYNLVEKHREPDNRP